MCVCVGVYISQIHIILSFYHTDGSSEIYENKNLRIWNDTGVNSFAGSVLIPGIQTLCSNDSLADNYIYICEN